MTDVERFLNWLTDEMLVSDEDWEYNYRAFPELCCRRLLDLGILDLKDNTYIRKESN